MLTSRNAKRKYNVSRLGAMRLNFDPKTSQWEMINGKYGRHTIFAPNVYNHRVAAHWVGYLENNGANPQDAKFYNFEN